jgi:hypothetical protein
MMYVSCGGGISNRRRNCNNPSPSNGGTRCFGDSVESRVNVFGSQKQDIQHRLRSTMPMLEDNRFYDDYMIR